MTAQAIRARPATARLRTRRSSLMISCAAAALVALASAPGRADAQAFQGTPGGPGPNIATQGSATRTITSQTSETITVQSSTATINWTPFDNQGTGTIDFLPAGNTATFTNDPQSTANFTVLNRIIPRDTSRPIALNGHVVSQLQDLSGNVSTGGRVWFYSPGGIVVGSTAVFDVGSLLLTANDPVSFGLTTGGVSGHFVADPGSTSAVTIQPGAQINATAENSYVALIAPVVQQGGSVRVNGSAAYIAGEDVSMTVNQGLFDITVNVGTTDSEGVVHTGTTGGPASTGIGDNHRIYMVAVPKNQAMSMFLGGTVGFDTATSASVENGEIILSAGHNVAGNSVSGTPVGAGAANIHIDAGTYTSNVYARATNDAFVASQVGDTTFRGNLTLVGGDRAHVGARNGHTVTILGDAIVSSGRSGLAGPSDGSESGGEALIYAEAGSTVDIGGNADVDAAAGGAAGQSTFGGIAGLHANGGDISVGGNLLVNASAVGGAGPQGGTATDATAGDASMISRDGGSIAVGGTAEVRANAASGFNGGLATGGMLRGGDASINADGGTIDIGGAALVFASAFQSLDTPESGGAFHAGDALLIAQNSGSLTAGSISVNANGVASNGVAGQAQTGGSGAGGSSQLVAATGGTITSQGSAAVYAEGSGGAGTATGGTGSGGTAALAAGGGSVSVAGQTVVSSAGFGGDGGGQGGNAFGGTTTVDISMGGSVALQGQAVLEASGFAGAGGTRGGGGDGGAVRVRADDGTITAAGDLLAYADGEGGMGATGGDGSGGSVQLDIFSGGGSVSVGGVTRLQASGSGGDGSGHAQGTGGAGGDGYGGTATVNVATPQGAGTSATLDLADTFVTSNGNGGFGGNGTTGGAGGDAFGGSSSLDIGAGATGSFAELQVYATTRAGDGGSGSQGAGGAGGDATGGDSDVSVAGTLNAATYSVYSRAFGGAGGAGSVQGGGGNAQGGSALLDVLQGGTATATVLTDVAVTAFGGNGSVGGSAAGGAGGITVDGTLSTADIRVKGSATGGAGTQGPGGAGTGGTVALNVGGVLTSSGATEVLAAGTGGSGSTSGGSGSGGTAILFAENGGTATFGTSTLVSTDGTGGAAGAITGGTGTGGFTQVRTFEGSRITAANLTASSDGTGGSGVNGGTGHGGFTYVTPLGADSQVALTGTTTARSNGTGGAGTVDGSGGEGTGGYVEVHSTAGATTLADARLQANGTGGSGGNGGSGSGGSIIAGATEGSFTLTGTLTGEANGRGGNALAGGAGGNGTGGVFLLAANLDLDTGDPATTDIHRANLSATGTGGDGGDAPQDAAGDGGEGQGGTVIAYAASGGGSLQIDILSADVGGRGGAGGDGGTGGTGGSGTGGSAALQLLNFGDGTTPVGEANVDLLSFTANGTGGAGGVGAEGNGSAGQGAGGSATINLFGAALTADTINLTANGSDSGGVASLSVFSNFDGTGGGSLEANTLTATANGGEQAGEILVSVSAGSSADLGAATLTALGSGTDPELGGGGIFIDLGGGFIPPPDTPTLAAAAAEGAVLTADSLTLATGGDVTVSSTGGAGLDVTGTLQADAGGSIQFLAGGDGTGGGAIHGGDIDLSGAGVTSDLAIAAERTLTVAAAEHFELGDVSAGQSMQLTAGGTANFLGLASAPQISVTSGDIDIEEGGQLGEAGITQTLSLTARSGEPVIVGGDEADDEGDDIYHLSQGEAGQIEAQAIVFTAAGTGDAQAPDILLRNLTIGGSQTEGGGVGHVEVNTGGSVVVEGQVLYGDAGAQDSLSINAGGNIEVITPTGGIALVNGSDAPTGTLELSADNVWVGSEELIGKLRQNPGYAGRDAELAAAAAEPNADGYVIAGGMTVNVGESLFVQNTGSATEFGGLTVGSGGLSIRPASQSQPAVLAFGSGVGQNGTRTTGEAFFQQVDFGLDEGAGYASDSRFNDCVIGGTTCGAAPPPPPEPPPVIAGPDQVLGPVEAVDSDDDPESGGGGVSVSMSNGLIDTGDVTVEALIEEPVTSGGDSSLWVDDDDDDDDDEEN
ncbi:MAG TPA: hypothetical protein VF727_04330 [Allosphingosinicella sp.]